MAEPRASGGGPRRSVGSAETTSSSSPPPSPGASQGDGDERYDPGLEAVSASWLLEEWEAALLRVGQSRYRAQQVFRWIHQRGQFDPRSMTNLGRELQQILEKAGLEAPGRVTDVHRAQDGTRKLVLTYQGQARVESVLIPMTPQSEQDADAAALDEFEPEEPSDRKTRVTLCISTQFGCAMGCVFCASGRAGLGRGLQAEEIVFQVLRAREHLSGDEILRNLVFMGMGEPLHHYDATVRAIRLLTSEAGQNMSPRRITVSTVGLVPRIRQLGHDFDGKVGLAVSLHAPDDETRSRIMPMNRRYPLAELLAALRDYPLPKRRRITIEYTLMAGVNDSLEQARKLAGLLRRIPVKINLIPMNPIAGTSLRAPDGATVEAFRDVLQQAGYSCFLRTRRGDDVSAACGQLAMEGVGSPTNAAGLPGPFER